MVTFIARLEDHWIKERVMEPLLDFARQTNRLTLHVLTAGIWTYNMNCKYSLFFLTLLYLYDVFFFMVKLSRIVVFYWLQLSIEHCEQVRINAAPHSKGSFCFEMR